MAAGGWLALALTHLSPQLIGNISTALIVVIFYFNFLLFENYLRLIVWAILFSQALRQAKNNVVAVLQYLSDDPDVDNYVRAAADGSAAASRSADDANHSHLLLRRAF